MKILSIGNSFSQDSTALLQLLTDKITVRNLYIGGCSLDMHAANIENDAAKYELQENGEKMQNALVSIKEALTRDKWDYITVQQVSGRSGVYESFYPYLGELLDYVRKYSDAEIVLHETWSYEIGSGHPDFAIYNSDREQMAQAIKETYEKVSAKENLRIIRVGEAVWNLRAKPSFDYENGGLSLTRDGFHLSLSYGRLLAASVWCKFFTGEIPQYFNNENLSQPMREVLEVLNIVK